MRFRPRFGFVTATIVGLVALPLSAGAQNTVETTISSGPAGTSNDPTPTFTFTGDPADASFQCSLDRARFATCSSPKTYSALPDGEHNFQVRALDGRSVDPSPESRTWTIDTAAPNTVIDSGPSGTVTSTSATFAFSSSEPRSTFQCSLDGGTFSNCASPTTYEQLTSGEHHFAVRALDPAGNADPTPATRSWTADIADRTPPETSILSAPIGEIAGGKATFVFESNEPGSSFLCVLDGGRPESCDNPLVLRKLRLSRHTLTVQAVDLAGNVDPSPAETSWTTIAMPDEYPTIATLRYKKRGSALQGLVGNENEKCRDRRQVVIFRELRGEDDEIGRAVSNESGSWSLDIRRLTPGSYYTKVHPRVLRGGRGLTCEGDTSPTITKLDGDLPPEGAAYFVATNGSDASGNGSRNAPWRTIQHAIDSLPFVVGLSAPTIYIQPGLYEEPGIVVDQVVVLDGEDFMGTAPDESVIIRRPEDTTSQAMPDDPYILSVTGYGAFLRDLTFDGRGSRHSAIGALGSRITIERVLIQQPQFHGIRLEFSKHFKIIDTEVTTERVFHDPEGIFYPDYTYLDYAIDIEVSQGSVTNFTGGDRIDHVITIDGEMVDGVWKQSDVLIRNADITGSPIWWADGIRIQANAIVTILDSKIHRLPGGDIPGPDDAHNLPYAGIEIAGSTFKELGAIIVRDTEISGFDTGLGFKLRKSHVTVQNTSISDVRLEAVQVFWHETDHTPPTLDFGGGPLGSTGGNTFAGGQWAIRHMGPFDVWALNNQWGAGVPEGRIFDFFDDPAVGKVIWKTGL